MKKDSNVPMGCFDGVEVSEIVGIYILSRISNEINKKQVGLYRDDDLVVLRNIPGSEMNRTRKILSKDFKNVVYL